MRTIDGNLTKKLRKHTSTNTLATDPGYPVKTYRELVESTAQLSFNNKDYLLFYRGQDSDYRNKVGASTLYPRIYRGDYVFQHEIDYRFDLLNSTCKILKSKFQENKIDGRQEVSRRKYIQWSILQHYEVLDTPLLDLTHSLWVACSFAQTSNKNETAIVYVLGLPYITNRISINTEHDLINIRLLSICPPQALRPYFQEGYLVGTDNITNEYDNKNELDFNNRLIAKFEIPNNQSFWGSGFSKIPNNILYPKNDIIFDICKKIKRDIKKELSESGIGKFIMLWTNLERKLITKAKKYNRNTFNFREAIIVLLKHEVQGSLILFEFNNLRKFRNKIVHNPMGIQNNALRKNIQNLQTFEKMYINEIGW